jgi:Ca-activated chloride channel family protein
MPHDFHFLRPEWLWLLIPLALVLWRLDRVEGGGDAWRGLVDAHLLPRLLTDDEGRAQRLPLLLLGLGWMLGVLALAGPTWERLPQPVYQAQDYRVVALDLSASMNATDLSPSRLAHARFEVLDLLRRAREGQTALLAYGAEPYVVSPLTSDTETIAAQVPSLETGLLPVQGARRTDLALDKAGELLRQAGAPDGEVILVTDGLDHPAAADEAARRLRAEGYRVSVLGIGGAKGAPVPLAGGGFLKDEKGAILLSKLDREALRTLASTGGGRYVPAGPDDRDIETLIPARGAGLAPRAQKQDTRADQWREEGPWLLLVLLPLAALGFRRGWLAPLVLVAALTPAPDAHAFGWDDLWLRPDQQAERLLQAGNPQEAAETFRRPDWRAAAQYQAGDYRQALQSLEGVQGAEADYNKGNALARSGQLEQAVAAYDRALEQDPQDEDARHNRDLVQKLLNQRRQEQQSRQGRQSQQDQQNQQGQGGQQDHQGRQEHQGERNQRGHAAQQDQKGQEEQRGQGQQGQQNPQDQKDKREQQDHESQQGQQEQKDQKGQQGQPDRQAQQPRGDQERQGQQGQQEKQEQGHKAQAEQKATQEAQEGSKGSNAAQAPKAEQPSRSDSSIPHSEFHTPHSSEPGLADLLGDKPGAGTRPAEDQFNTEDRQAMEQMLRRVEDDPAGLLRQRFLLQHLRRTGKLP